MSDNDKDYIDKDFVYTGKRMNGDGKLTITVQTIGEDGKLEEAQVYVYNKKMDRIVGGVYKGAKFSPTGSKGIAQSTWSRRWDVQSDIIEWQAKDEQAEVKARLQKMEKDEGRISEIEKMLLPLREQYESYRFRHDYAGMEALEKSVLRALKSAPRVIEK